MWLLIIQRQLHLHQETSKKVREKSRECHNHKPQPFPDHKRKRKPINLNKHKPNKRTKSTKISSLFPKRGNRNTKRTEKYKNKMTHGKTYNKSPRRINHKATNSKTNTITVVYQDYCNADLAVPGNVYFYWQDSLWTDRIERSQWKHCQRREPNVCCFFFKIGGNDITKTSEPKISSNELSSW